MSGTRSEIVKPLPDRLYKYRRWDLNDDRSFHNRLLTHNEVYLAEPSSFNDPFDCQITMRLDGSSAGRVRQSLKKSHQQRYPSMPRKEREKAVRERVLDFTIPERREREQEKQRRALNEGYGIFSLSANRESLPMWAHYADSHQGLCVGFSTSVLEQFSTDLFEHSGIPGDLLQVKYVDDYPKIDPFAGDHKEGKWAKVATETKSAHWKYEEEFRLIVGADKLTNRCYSLPDNAIRIVILGVRISPESAKEIRSIADPRGIPVVQAQLKEYSFGLDIPAF